MYVTLTRCRNRPLPPSPTLLIYTSLIYIIFLYILLHWWFNCLWSYIRSISFTFSTLIGKTSDLHESIGIYALLNLKLQDYNKIEDVYLYIWIGRLSMTFQYCSKYGVYFFHVYMFLNMCQFHIFTHVFIIKLLLCMCVNIIYSIKSFCH